MAIVGFTKQPNTHGAMTRVLVFFAVIALGVAVACRTMELSSFELGFAGANARVDFRHVDVMSIDVVLRLHADGLGEYQRLARVLRAVHLDSAHVYTLTPDHPFIMIDTTTSTVYIPFGYSQTQ